MTSTTLQNASRPRTTPRSFWPALVIALVACPAASVAAAVVGCQVALGSGSLSPDNFGDSVLWGLLFGVIGGLVVAGIARVFRSKAIPVSIVGSVIVSGGSGVSLCVLVSALASC